MGQANSSLRADTPDAGSGDRGTTDHHDNNGAQDESTSTRHNA